MHNIHNTRTMTINRLVKELNELIKHDTDILAKDWPGMTCETPVPDDWPQDMVSQVSGFTRLQTLKHILTYCTAKEGL